MFSIIYINYIYTIRERIGREKKQGFLSFHNELLSEGHAIMAKISTTSQLVPNQLAASHICRNILHHFHTVQ